MGYDKLDKSRTASYKRDRKAHFEAGLKIFLVILLINLTIFGVVFFVINSSGNDAVAAETPAIVADSAAIVTIEDGAIF